MHSCCASTNRLLNSKLVDTLLRRRALVTWNVHWSSITLTIKRLFAVIKVEMCWSEEHRRHQVRGIKCPHCLLLPKNVGSATLFSIIVQSGQAYNTSDILRRLIMTFYPTTPGFYLQHIITCQLSHLKPARGVYHYPLVALRQVVHDALRLRISRYDA
jgi:hypothetical protein